MTSINQQINRTVRLMRLEAMSRLELAHWLINSFSPDRYHDENDCVEPAIRLLYQKADTDLTNEFVSRLFGMFGQLPPIKPNVECGQVISFRKF